MEETRQNKKTVDITEKCDRLENMVYKFTSSIGGLTEYRPDPPKVKYQYGIFVYNPDEDVSVIEGTSPCLYEGLNTLATKIPLGSIRESLRKGQTVVIRPVEVIGDEDDC